MEKAKTVGFIGHCDDWRIPEVKDKLRYTIERLIIDGYTVFLMEI